MACAMRLFVEQKFGENMFQIEQCHSSESFEEAGPTTVLSPGVNPLKDVESLGKKLSYTAISKNLHNISLGQQTNKPPSRVFANLHKALDNFTQETLETSSKRVQV